MAMVEALIFDFDGIIVDTETPDYEIWLEVYRDHGVDLPLEVWAQGVGLCWDEFNPMAHLKTLITSPIDEEAVAEKRRLRFHETLAAYPPMAGVAELMREAKGAGLKVGVASNSDRPWVEGHLRQRDLFDWVDVIRTADDVPNAKPAPDVYEETVAVLGVSPERTVAFEDSPHGLTAAIAAGLHGIAVPNSVTKHYDLTHAHRILESIAHTTLKDLHAWVKQRVT